jgi:hypothetical protein
MLPGRSLLLLLYELHRMRGTAVGSIARIDPIDSGGHRDRCGWRMPQALPPFAAPQTVFGLAS